MDHQQFTSILARFDELEARLGDPAVLADREQYLAVVKEHAGLGPVVEAILRFRQKQRELEENLQLLQAEDDEELRDLLKEEVREAKTLLPRLEEELQILLLPKDPRDARNVFVEIRGGAGGEEAALFGEVLFRMYQAYAAQRGYQLEIMDWGETELGGLKEAVFALRGADVYSRMKFESGVHRVQRVPVTESGGRIHTSTVTVAVLPEVDEVEIEIHPGDVLVDTYRASGAGGQHVNKTDSAIRLTHVPTGIVVTCQDERSQHKNRERAYSVLRAKLFELEESKRSAGIAEARRDQVGTGERSERIRTYNYPQGRVTDHRIGLTLYKLEDVLAGDLDLLLEPLIREEQTRRLAEGKSFQQ